MIQIILMVSEKMEKTKENIKMEITEKKYSYKDVCIIVRKHKIGHDEFVLTSQPFNKITLNQIYELIDYVLINEE